MDKENRVAVFIDFENIKRAVDDFFINERVDLKRILDEIQQVSDGRIVLKRAYADWGQFKDYRSDLLDNATEPVQAFALTYKGKNGADIKIAIDAMDVVLRQADITHVALVSGDSDFTPLVSKLREFGKYVLGVGVRSNTSNYLAKACDQFSYYDDLRRAADDNLPQRSVPSTPMDPVALLATALAALGNRPVPGSALKTRMRLLDPMFDETRHGHTSFLDFLRAHEELIDLHKPAVGDVTVAPKGQLAEGISSENGNGNGYGASSAHGPRREGDSSTPRTSAFHHPGYTPYAPTATVANGHTGGSTPPGPTGYNGAPAVTVPVTPADRLRLWLRENNFRYVPSAERHQIMTVMYDIFAEPESAELSLKEAKDRLHLWFEENRPSVPWESINSTVYHLFYTWCFFFDRSDADDGKQLWDRRTNLQTDIQSAEDLILKCEKGVVRKIWEKDREGIDIDALIDWLYDGAEEKREHVAELVRSVASTGVNPSVVAGVPPRAFAAA